MNGTSLRAVVGLEWGDEGFDLVALPLSLASDINIKSISIPSEKRHLPIGYMNQEAMNILAAGTALDLNALLAEMNEERDAKGLEIDNVFIDERASLVMPWHIALENVDGKSGDGIGTCLEYKRRNLGVKAADIMDKDRFSARLDEILPEVNGEVEKAGLPQYEKEDIMILSRMWVSEFSNYIIDTLPVIKDALESETPMLLEVPSSTMRDSNFGAYPHTETDGITVASALSAAGIPANKLGKVYGVIKAYSTNEHEGPFMTEIKSGTKRYGWTDTAVINHTAWINGVTDLALTHLSALDSFEKIKLGTGYMLEGEWWPTLPEAGRMSKAKPIYQDKEGWMSETKGIDSFEALPENAKALISAIEELTELPVTLIADDKKIIER